MKLKLKFEHGAYIPGFLKWFIRKRIKDEIFNIDAMNPDIIDTLRLGFQNIQREWSFKKDKDKINIENRAGTWEEKMEYGRLICTYKRSLER